MKRFHSLHILGISLHKVSFNPSRCYDNRGESNDEEYPKLQDASNITCHNVSSSDAKLIDVIWNISSRAEGIFHRITMGGTQECVGKNTVWYTKGFENVSMAKECQVIEYLHDDLRLCDVVCSCPSPQGCRSLYFRVHMTPWMPRSLLICHQQTLTSLGHYAAPIVNV